MRLDRPPGSHLTYCTNIHPGESWDEVARNLDDHVPRVKALVCPNATFGVGLRLSAAAAAETAADPGRERLETLLAKHGLYVFTINGFPYGAFHRTRVKEQVYRPDWTEDARLTYTVQLADLLARLLPAGCATYGSISTVPVGWRPELATPESITAAAEHLLRCTAYLWRLRERSGREIALALEPEPGCLLETTADAVQFFEAVLLSSKARGRFAALTGLPEGQIEPALRRHLGVCLDACHAAVQFESPSQAVATLGAAGIRIAKVQLSAGLCVHDFGEATLEALRAFDDGVYLHQVVERLCHAGTDAAGVVNWSRYADLSPALAQLHDSSGTQAASREWRIHFHVPIFGERLGDFANTQPFLRDLLALHLREPISDHWEVETYTWEVIPPALRSGSAAEAVARELTWVIDELAR